MSLPQATREVSENPGKGSVTVPVNKEEKERDVGRKIRLYGAIEAFRQGRLPTNKQMDEALVYLREHSPVDVDLLSEDGRKAVDDTREIIETIRLMLDEKNADELLQNFVWNTRDIDRQTFSQGEVPLPVDRETARSESQQALQHLRTLLHIVVTNSEARKLLSDFSVIGRDLLAKSAVKAAETIAPSEDALSRVDEAAPENEFVTAGGRRVGPDETPVLEARLPGTGTTIRSDPREDQAVIQAEEGSARPVSDIRREGKAQARDFAEEGMKGGEDIAKQPDGSAKASEAQAKKSGLMGKIKSLSDRIPSQHKDAARRGKHTATEQIDRGKHYLTDEYFHDERRQKFIQRGKKVIIECQKHEDYQQSIRWLLDYIENYASHGGTVAGHGGNMAQGVFSDPKIDLAIRQVRTLLERFANNTSLVDVINALDVLINISRRDPELRSWFKSVDTYLRRILLEEGYVVDQDCSTQGQELRESGRRFFDEQYRGQFDDLFKALSEWFGAMAQDPLNKRFADAWAQLGKDLLFSPSGDLTFKPHLWSDIRRTILPSLTQKLGYFPIPRIEYTDPSIDLVIENLALQGRNVFPNIVSFEMNNFVKFSPYNVIRDEGRHEIHLKLEQMQADIRDVAFYYRIKSGLTKGRDSGMADVLIGGKGITVNIVLHSPPSAPAAAHATTAKAAGAATGASTRTTTPAAPSGHLFQIKSVQTKIHSLKFSIRGSKHDFIYNSLKPLATNLIKRQIQKAITDVLTNGLDYLDTHLVAIRDQMASVRAQEEGGGRTAALKSVFQKKKEEPAAAGATVGDKRRRTTGDTASMEEKKKPHQFKVVSDIRNSLLANEGHPAGWVKMTEERDRAAVTGTDWRSEAFDLVQKRGERDQGRISTGEGVTVTSAAGGSRTTASTVQAPPPVSTHEPAPTTTHRHQPGGLVMAEGMPVDKKPMASGSNGYVEPGTGSKRLAAAGVETRDQERVPAVPVN